MISNEVKIPYHKISSGDMEKEDWENMIMFSEKVLNDPNDPSKAGIFVDDVTKDLHRMIAIIRRCVRKKCK